MTNCQVGVSVHLVNERASCAANWRLFCPRSWDDEALADPVAAAVARRCRELSRIPGQVRHTEEVAAGAGDDHGDDRVPLQNQSHVV
jgi:hypothetical protein